MRLELHSHTHFSKAVKVVQDGVETPENMVKTAARKGLDAIAITDHNVIRGAEEAGKYAKKYGIEVIKGEEIKTADGDVLALNIQERILPYRSVDETVDMIHDQGGISVAVHPFGLFDAGIREQAVKCDVVEVFNSLCLDRLSNRKALSYAKKHNKNMVASSDAHSIGMIGNGVTVTRSSDVENSLKDILHGRVTLEKKYTSTLVLMDTAVRRLQMSYPYTIKYINANYRGPKKVVARKMLGLVNKSPGRIDYFFKGMAYVTLGGVLVYGAARHMKHMRTPSMNAEMLPI